MKATLIRVILVLALAELGYLALANLALNLPLTQSLLNQHRPEKYALHWERAWSWYPLKMHARGISANGQTSTQQWQADCSAASLSLSLLPLLQRTVKLYAVDVQDVALRLRPRPRPDKDDEAIRAFFPPVRDRDPDSAAVPRPARKKRGGWRVAVEDVHAHGRHDVWVRQFRGTLDGDLRGNVTYKTKGGPVSVTGGEADVALRSLTVNRDWKVSSGGSVEGRFELAPFVPAEQPGLKALAFLSADAAIDAPVASLGFLDFYLRGLGGMEVDGSGRLSGRLKYEEGDLASGTDLEIAADQLVLTADPYEVEGAGGIHIAVDPAQPQTLAVEIGFGDLKAMHRNDRTSLFTGQGLEVLVSGSTRILPDEMRHAGSGQVAVTIPSVRVKDLRVYQRYLPEKWGVVLNGGEGFLQGHADYSASALRAELSVASDAADISVKDYRFRSNLDFGLQVRGGAAYVAGVDLSGSYLRLDEARLAATGSAASKPWQASLTVEQGRLGIPMPEEPGQEAGFKVLFEAFKARGLRALLSSADARLEAVLRVSDLAWINSLFTNPFDLSVSGAGEITADVRLAAGSLAQGTTLKARPKGMTVEVLDYVAQGAGGVTVVVEKGGEEPDLRLEAELKDAHLRRRGEQEAMVEQVSMTVSALAAGIAVDGGGQVTSLGLRIPSARVKDMRVYNQYLPEGSPLELLAGQADLSADIRLGPSSASGFVKLVTDGLRARLDEQDVAGRVTLDVRLQDGVPKNMEFDISGSKLMLDGFRVAGGQQGFDRPDWQARFELHKARTQWRKPIRLDLEAGLQMNDSRPIVAMFANQRGKHGFLDKILTVEDIRGEAEMHIADNRVLLPYAMAGSDKIEVGAKALVSKDNREGIFYARFRKLKGILKVRNGERNFDLLRARKTFDAYAPGKTTLDFGGRDASAASDPGTDRQSARKAPDASEEADTPREKREEQDPLGAFGGSL